MTTLRSRIHTESTRGSAVSILADTFVYRCHFAISFESLRNFVSSPDLSSGHSPPSASSTSRPAASLSGVDSLKEALADFGREQVFEDLHVEKPETGQLGCLTEATVSTDRQDPPTKWLGATRGRHYDLEADEPRGLPVPPHLRQGREC